MSSSYTLEQVGLLNYFDQFEEYEVNLTKLIQNFKTDAYTLDFSNQQPLKIKMKNLFSRYDIVFKYQQQNNSFSQYTINEYQRPDQLSYKLYGQIDYWWVILLTNNIKNPIQEWPINQEQLNYLVDLLYLNEGLYSKTMYYQLLFEQNENKKNILVPTTDAIFEILNLYRDVYQNLRKN